MNNSRNLQLDNFFEQSPRVPGTSLPSPLQRANTAHEQAIAALKAQITELDELAGYESEFELPDDLGFLTAELERAHSRTAGSVSKQRATQPAPRQPAKNTTSEFFEADYSRNPAVSSASSASVFESFEFDSDSPAQVRSE